MIWLWMALGLAYLLASCIVGLMVFCVANPSRRLGFVALFVAIWPLLVLSLGSMYCLGLIGRESRAKRAAGEAQELEERLEKEMENRA